MSAFDEVAGVPGQDPLAAARTPAPGAPCGCDEAVERLWE